MKTTIKDNVLHIEITLHASLPSATGKTLTVASSNGNQPTDGRSLASAPADVPPTPFILPNQTVSVLAHPDFTSNNARVRLQKVNETEWISIRSSNHVLM